MGKERFQNSHITDAVTQADVKVLGEAPAMAMSWIGETLGHSTGILFEAVQRPQEDILPQMVSNQGVVQLYSQDTVVSLSGNGPRHSLQILVDHP